MKEKGFAPLALVIIIFLVAFVGAFYLGTIFKSQELTQSANSLKQSPTPTSLPIPTSKPTLSQSTSSAISNYDYSAHFRNLFPKELPVYPGAKMENYMNQGACKAELLSKNPNCLQVMFIFKVKGSSVENVVNWYVNNPIPGWTYRGVYGDQRDYQFGDIYKNTRDIYYRLIYRYPSTEKGEIEIDYNGPYPYSDLSPKP